MSSSADNLNSGVSLELIVAYMDEVLETSATPDYPNALNGLQLANKGKIRKIAAAVDFSTPAIEAAIKENANLLIVHHGMFWGGLQPITGRAYTRFRRLLDADLAVYSSHLPLDRHPDIGNNVLLAKILGLEPSAKFARFKDIFIGVQGDSDIATDTLIDQAQTFSRANGGDSIATERPPDHRTRRWAICTGAGASADTLQEASNEGVDTLIVGEGPHWTAVEAAERGITAIYLGHYASETLGIHALGSLVCRQFNLDLVTISAPTGL
jgi:dinuclear metal center YbgI/SA1388 family protein